MKYGGGGSWFGASSLPKGTGGVAIIDRKTGNILLLLPKEGQPVFKSKGFSTLHCECLHGLFNKQTIV